MNFELYCAGVARDEGEVTQLGGGGTVLVVRDNYNRAQCREFGYGLGSSDLDRAEIQVARLALASVAPAYRGFRTVLYTLSPLVASMLSTRQPPQLILAEPVAELRRWYAYYRDVSVVLAAEPAGYLERAVELARRSLDSQANTDSLTFPLEVANDVKQR